MRAIIALIIMAVAIPAKAANLDIHLKWKDGNTFEYYNMPETVTVEQLAARIQKDFPNRSLQDIVVADTRPAGAPYQPNVQPAIDQVNNYQKANVKPQPQSLTHEDNGEWSTTTKVIVGLLAIAAIYYLAKNFDGSGGPCDSYYDRASDGSLCGYRAASMRPGGR